MSSGAARGPHPTPMALFRRKTTTARLQPAPPGEGKEIPITREELVMAVRPEGLIAEQYRRLRNSIQALNPDGAARTVLVTSAVRGEGKSVATLNLALAMVEVPRMRVRQLSIRVVTDVALPVINRRRFLTMRDQFQ